MTEKLTLPGDLEIGGDLTVTGSITGILHGCLAIPPTYSTGSADDRGAHPTYVATSSSVHTHYGFIVPSDFTTLEAAKIAFLPGSTDTYTPDFYADYCAEGEDYDNATASKTDASEALTADKLKLWDISSILSGIAAGDLVGVKVVHGDTSSGYWGLMIIEYS